MLARSLSFCLCLSVSQSVLELKWTKQLCCAGSSHDAEEMERDTQSIRSVIIIVIKFDLNACI